MEIENNRIASLLTPNSGQGAPVENHNNRGKNTSPESTGAAGSTSDRVSLTGGARLLHELEAQIASEPVVDRKRVDAVRTAVENGTFTVDPDRIADKLLSLEQALTDAR